MIMYNMEMIMALVSPSPSLRLMHISSHCAGRRKCRSKVISPEDGVIMDFSSTDLSTDADAPFKDLVSQ